METFHIGAYWDARKESAEDCAHRAVDFFACLARRDPFLVNWFALKDAPETKPRKLKLDVPTLRELLLAGRYRNDTNHDIMEDLGFNLWVWNGQEDNQESILLHIVCGSYNPFVSNSCVFQGMPNAGTIGDRILTVTTLIAIMKCIISSWEPDWAIVDSSAYRDSVPEEQRTVPSVGWVTYLPKSYEFVSSLVSPSQVISVDNSGSIIVTGVHFTASNPTHVAAVNQVWHALNEAGLLKDD